MTKVTDLDFRRESADLRQQDVFAAAGAQSRQACSAWDGMVAAVIKVVAAVAGTETS
jgi:hypothetical protein